MANFAPLDLQASHIRRPARFFFYSILLVVYACFFSVQFFFNFDAFPNSQTLCRICPLFHTSPERQAAVAKSAPLHSSHLHTIRLNKRFQQEDMPPCTLTSIVVPECYIPLRTPDFSRYLFFPSHVPDDNPHRGPPTA